MALLLLHVGCSSPPEPEVPKVTTVPAQLVAEEGASLYVLEAPRGWLEEQLGATGDARWIPAGRLRLLLRHALSQRTAFFIGHADFQPTEGYPTEATLFNPDAKAHGRPAGSGIVGFRVRLTSKSLPAGPDGGTSFDTEWALEQLTDKPGAKGEGVQRQVERIDGGTHALPAGASLLIRHPKPDGREYLVLLRVVSLKAP